MAGSPLRLMRPAAVLLGFVALSVAMTWPLAQHLDTHVVNAKWHYDSMVNLHVLGSRMHYALGLSDALTSAYDNYFCAPTPYSIANNENHFGLALLYAPFFLASGDPLLAYNLLLLSCLALSGFCMYLLVRELSGSELGGLLGGVAYAFCPYVFFELGRIQLVAAQWVPLFALYLHRSARTASFGNLLALGLIFAMQVGSCLYYAMFLVVYAAFVGVWLLLQHKTYSRAFLLKLGGAVVIAIVPVYAMVRGHLKARKDFDLTRSQALTDSYAGKLDHLLKVYPQNKALSFLHDAADGPTEPIAFPGFVITALALVALVVPIVAAFRQLDATARKRLLVAIPTTVLVVLAAVALSFVAHTFLVGLVLIIAGAVAWRRLGRVSVWSQTTAVYGVFLLLGLVLFLGPVPFQYQGSPVRGLYYYLYKHVLGFDGIRYVSRFVVLNMMSLCVLGGIGAAWLIRGSRALRAATFAALLFAMLFELRNAPVALAKLPSQRDVSPVYNWLAQHPGTEPIATMPAYPMGYFGARNDYLALFHRRRTIDGKSSWMPPITHAFIQESRRFPRRTGTRMLQALGVKYLVLHTAEYEPTRRERILSWLDKRPDDYRLQFHSGRDFVYEVLPPKDTSASLLSTPKLPDNVEAVPRHGMLASASSWPSGALLAIDGDPDTAWKSKRRQTMNDWFELELPKPRSIAALDLTDFAEAFDAPAAFKLLVREPNGEYKVVMTRPELRFYADQVFHPRAFVFRVVLPSPVFGDAVKVQLLDGVAGSRWSVSEATVWVAK